MTQVYHHALPAGTRIASYEIRDTLGVGAFGITYRAYDHALDRIVAIKEYLPGDLAVRIADGTTVSPKSENDSGDYHYGLTRFLDEARTLAKFHEPNVVRIITYMEAHGTAYFVMDYEEGESLEQRLKTAGRPTEDDIRAIAVPILRSLRGVHAQNFLHRDIKPANIYIRRDGSPVLLDFGAARQAMGEHGRAATGIVTPGYAPFEQYLADDKQGPWSDIYALGATMYRCVTGLAPAPATERIAALHDRQPDPLTGIGGSLKNKYSAAFLDAMMWMLRPLPKDRPQSVEDALTALTGDAPAAAATAAEARRETAAGAETPADDRLEIDVDAPTLALGDTQQLAAQENAPGGRPEHPSASAPPPAATPRRWLRDGKRRRALAAAAALAAGVAIVVLLKPFGATTPAPATDPKQAARAAPFPLLKQAEDAVTAEDWGHVAQLAERALGQNPKNAEALLLKGHIAYRRDRQTATALRHYDEALRLAPDLKSDERLLAHLVGALGTAGPPAAVLLARHPSPAAVGLLSERTGRPGFAGRNLAADVLARWGEAKRIQEDKRALLDLKEAPGCPQRREAVVRIRELRLKQALPALKKMTDVGFLERVFAKHPNACLFDEARKTISALQGRTG